MTSPHNKPAVAFSRFLSDLAKYRPRLLLTVVVLMLLRSMTEGVSFVLLIPLLGLGSDAMKGAGDAGAGAGLAQGWLQSLLAGRLSLAGLLAVFLVVMLLRTLLGYAGAVAASAYSSGLTHHIRSRIYTALSRASWLHLAGSRQAEDTRALTSQIECASTATALTLNLASGSLTMLTGLGVALLLSVPSTLAVVAAGAIMAVPMVVYQRRAYVRGIAAARAYQDLYDVLVARMNGLKLAKAFAIERQLEDDFSSASDGLRKAEIAAQENGARAALVQEAMAAALLGALVYAAIALFRIASLELVVLIMIFARLTPIGYGIQSNLRSLAGLLPEYMLLRQREAAAAAAAEGLSIAHRPISLRSALSVEAITFRHPGASGDAVLKETTVAIPAGSAVGILGLSGAGKSTLADIMAGLIPPDSGRIVVDGVPIDASNRADWRASVAYLPQDAPLFHDTLRANLLLGARRASDADIWACLETVQAAGLVRSLPEGLETLAGDRGVRLSGGERQRLRLASALLRKPELLILDESTNALSPSDEAQIIEALQRQRGAMTIVLIAHRTTSVAWTDRVLLVREGRIVADGSPADVIGLSSPSDSL